MGMVLLAMVLGIVVGMVLGMVAVHPHVDGETGGTGERLFTVWTVHECDVRVCLHVNVETAFTRTTLAAHCTLERFLASVHTHVTLSGSGW